MWFGKTRGLMVLDDLMEEEDNNKHVLDLFTKGSHHRNVPVFVVIYVKTFFSLASTPRASREMHGERH